MRPRTSFSGVASLPSSLGGLSGIGLKTARASSISLSAAGPMAGSATGPAPSVVPPPSGVPRLQADTVAARPTAAARITLLRIVRLLARSLIELRLRGGTPPARHHAIPDLTFAGFDEHQGGSTEFGNIEVVGHRSLDQRGS